MSGKELFLWCTASTFRKLLSIYLFSYFRFGFDGRIWDLIVSVPDHCLSFYFTLCRLEFFVFLSRTVSGEGSVIRLYRFLIIAFSSP